MSQCFFCLLYETGNIDSSTRSLDLSTVETARFRVSLSLTSANIASASLIGFISFSIPSNTVASSYASIGSLVSYARLASPEFQDDRNDLHTSFIQIVFWTIPILASSPSSHI
jgi:hypothetical protein